MDCKFPSEITAGLTFRHLVILTAYPAPDWALNVYLRGDTSINMVAVPSGSAHLFHSYSGQTIGWQPGNYWYSMRAQRGDEVVEIDNGEVRILRDLATTPAGYDGRSHAQKVLEAIEAVIEKRATLDQERYRINNRELYRTPISELLKLRDKYRDEVRREQAARCGKSLFGGVVRVRLK